MIIVSTLVSSMIYSLINLDATAIAQTMISRPIVVSPLIGAVIGLLNGDVVSGAKAGVIIGVLLEFFWINLLPLGSSVPPNATISSSVATTVVCYLSMGGQIESYLITTGLIYGVCCGYVGGKGDTWIRALNAKLVNKAEAFVENGELSVINRLNLQAIGVSILVNALLCAGLILTGIILLPVIIEYFPQKVLSALGSALWLFLLVCLGITLEAFVTKKTIFYFGAVWVVMAVIMSRL